MKWISVKDKLPNLSVKTDWGMISETVLCRHKDYHHEDCILNEGIEEGDKPYWTYVYDGEYCETVTHWMPLPEPPKK